MKKRKSKLVALIFAFVICIGAMSFGIYAAVTATLNASGTVTFNAYGIDLDIEGSIIGATGTGINTSYSGTTNKTRQPSKNLISSTPWTFGNLQFNEENAMDINEIFIRFVFKISNYSMFPIEASINVPSISGLRISKEDVNYSYSFDSTLGADERYILLYLEPISYNTPVNLANLNLQINVTKTTKTETDVSKFTWSTPSGGNINITGKTAANNDPSVIIPRKNGSNYVRKIDNYALFQKIILPNSLTSLGNIYSPEFTTLTIPSGITSLSSKLFTNGEFECTIETIIISKTVSSIQEDTFLLCSSIKNLIVDNENASFCTDDYSALYNKDKTTLYTYASASRKHVANVPETVTTIKSCAFNNSFYVKTINIPKSVVSIEYYSGDDVMYMSNPVIFIACNGLKKINVDSANPNYSSDTNGLIYNKNKSNLLYCPAGLTGDFVIPSTVTSIKNFAFSLTSLSSITIPSSVTVIEMGAFSYMKDITTLTIPASVNTIGIGAFGYSSELSKIYFERTTAFTEVGMGMALGIKQNSVLYFKNNTVLNEIYQVLHYDASLTTKALY